MDGLEARVAIRQSEGESGERIPIVAMTAHALQGDLERCLAAGMDDYISKPIQANKFFAMIEDLVAKIDDARSLYGAENRRRLLCRQAPKTISQAERKCWPALVGIGSCFGNWCLYLWPITQNT